VFLHKKILFDYYRSQKLITVFNCLAKSFSISCDNGHINHIFITIN